MTQIAPMHYNSPQSVASRRTSYDWSFRSTRWGLILRYQHWGALLVFVPVAVITALAHWTFQKNPVQRQALLYDASISYPEGHPAIPDQLAVVYNWLAFIVAILVVELLIYWKQQSLTMALAAVLHHGVSCTVNFFIIVAVAELTKPFTGRLRPDFLYLCQPSNLASSQSGTATPITGSAAPLSTVQLGQPVTDCTNPDARTVADARHSFPSGHASNSMCVAWYTALYIVWSLYLRQDLPFPTRMFWNKSLWKRLLGEVLHGLLYGFVLLALCLSWFIGATRYWDNRHHISDIIGGFILGIIFTTPYFLKALGLHRAMREQIDGQASKVAAADTAAGATVHDNDVATAALPVSSMAPAGVGVMQQQQVSGLSAVRHTKGSPYQPVVGGHDVALNVPDAQRATTGQPY